MPDKLLEVMVQKLVKAALWSDEVSEDIDNYPEGRLEKFRNDWMRFRALVKIADINLETALDVLNVLKECVEEENGGRAESEKDCFDVQ